MTQRRGARSARLRMRDGTAMRPWRIPPIPSAAAPMARGPTPGAKVAAVPVVPHRTAATRTERIPGRDDRVTARSGSWMLASQRLSPSQRGQHPDGDPAGLLEARGCALEARAGDGSFEEEAQMFGHLTCQLRAGQFLEVASKDLLDLFLVRADSFAGRGTGGELGGRVEEATAAEPELIGAVRVVDVGIEDGQGPVRSRRRLRAPRGIEVQPLQVPGV